MLFWWCFRLWMGDCGPDPLLANEGFPPWTSSSVHTNLMIRQIFSIFMHTMFYIQLYNLLTWYLRIWDGRYLRVFCLHCDPNYPTNTQGWWLRLRLSAGALFIGAGFVLTVILCCAVGCRPHSSSGRGAGGEGGTQCLLPHVWLSSPLLP